MKIGRYLVLFILAAVACSSAARSQEASVTSQYPIISAYIYNFTQFTTWPDKAIKDEFSVCVLGRDPFGASLAPLKSRSVNQKNIAIRYQRRGDGLTGCNILFIAESESDHVDEIVKSLGDAPVLTMSNIDGFTDAGGMVEFQRNDQKIGIKIGLTSVQNSGITISSKLLRIADTSQ